MIADESIYPITSKITTTDHFTARPATLFSANAACAKIRFFGFNLTR